MREAKEGQLYFYFYVHFFLGWKGDPVRSRVLVPHPLHEKDTHTSWKKASEGILCLGGTDCPRAQKKVRNLCVLVNPATIQPSMFVREGHGIWPELRLLKIGVLIRGHHMLTVLRELSASL